MFVATHYTVSLDIGKGVYVVRNKDVPMCPECGVLMSGYDHRKRKAIGADGKPRIFLIRCLRCPVCRQIHAEIPDSLIPYKHYASEVIKAVQQRDGSLCPADDSTIRRWKKQVYPPAFPVLTRSASVCFIWTNSYHLVVGGDI